MRFTNGQNTLALAAAATDGLEAHTVLRIIGGHSIHRFGQCQAQLIDGIKIYSLDVGGGQHHISLIFQAYRLVIKSCAVYLQVMLGNQGLAVPLHQEISSAA